MAPQFTNHLNGEISPYLLQHAHNPVDWYPWSSEAFEKAKQENKPVLLSIGYSACHWCHVMAHESFENDEIAGLMNDNFVNIKVDREERPDLDHIYMNAVQMMTHHGGWPMTVFLTPEGVPFYGGTYFPPQDRYNMPGFPRVLISVAEAYRDRREDITQTSTSLLNELKRVSEQENQAQELNSDLLDAAYSALMRSYDSVNGGFGGAPKFPPSMTLEFLLRTYARTGNIEALKIVEHTCSQMANGGMYDQLAGGFHRYSTDAKWLVPHFEKMLYDNALLSRLYLHLFQVSQKSTDSRVAEDILDYVVREMTDSLGGFYSTQDADSEGHEGKFFVWDLHDIESALGANDARVFNAYFNVTKAGNFEGSNILNVKDSVEEVARSLGMTSASAEQVLDAARQKLFDLRESRIKPDRDEKILTAWNGLMLASFAEAGAILSRPDYTEVARRNAHFLLTHLKREGLLLRVYKDGVARLNAYLEDYAFLAEGLLTLYETTGETKWFTEAQSLADRMVDEFWDNEKGGFFFTGKSHESLIVRSKDYYDNATPSGNSVAAHLFLRLSILSDNDQFRTIAGAVLRGITGPMRQFPSAFGYALGAADMFLSTPKEIAIVAGDGSSADFIREAWHSYLPNKVVAVVLTGEVVPAEISLLKDRPAVNRSPTAYVCQNYTCKRPVTTLPDFAAQLRE